MRNHSIRIHYFVVSVSSPFASVLSIASRYSAFRLVNSAKFGQYTDFNNPQKCRRRSSGLRSKNRAVRR